MHIWVVIALLVMQADPNTTVELNSGWYTSAAECSADAVKMDKVLSGLDTVLSHNVHCEEIVPNAK